MSRQYTFGCVPSRPDPRDYPITRVTAVRAAFPESFRLPLPPDVPYDQNPYPMCVAFATDAEICQVNAHRQHGRWTRYSAGYRYGKRDPGDYTGEGMEPREALASLLKYGTPPHYSFPYLGYYPDLAVKLQLPEFAGLDALAYPQKIGAYVRLYTVEEIKTALMDLGPVLYCIPVYQSFMAGGHLLCPDTSREEMLGYHALVVYGWAEDCRWLVLNSWGRDWGPLGGFCTVPFSYPTSEVWSVTDLAPDPVPPAPDTKPEVSMYLKRDNPDGLMRIQFGAFRVEANARAFADTIQAILEKGGATVRRIGF